MKKKYRFISLIVLVLMALSIVPFNIYAASKSSNIKTYAFFGSDSRATGTSWKKDKTHGTEGKPRSDVIMLLTVNKKAKTIRVTSIYRDTMLEVSGKGKEYGKANKAYADGGAKRAVKVLQKNLNIKIDGYAVTNFQGVAEVIDSLGGITLSVENDKIEKVYKTKKLKRVPNVVNNYIDEMRRVYGVPVKHIKSGKQKLNGFQAVSYARVRYTPGSDKMRTKRQKKVLHQMFKKFKKAKLSKKISVINKAYSSIQTNMSLSDFTTLLKSVSKYKMVKTNGFPYYKKDILVTTKKERTGKSWLVVPCALSTNVTKLHKMVYGQNAYGPDKVVRKYSKKITKITKQTYSTRNKNQDNKY